MNKIKIFKFYFKETIDKTKIIITNYYLHQDGDAHIWEHFIFREEQVNGTKIHPPLRRSFGDKKCGD